MKAIFSSVLWLALFAALGLLFPLPLSAGAPMDQVRSTLDNVLAVLNSPRLKADAIKNERRQQLRAVILPRFDFAEMAKRALGSHWRRRPPEEHKEFVEVFADLLENAYVDRIEAYTDEKFVYVRESEDKDFAEVNTKVVTRKGEDFSINYKLHLVNGEWRIYDVVIENISLVNNYRSQFNRIITKSSYEDLVRRMKEKRIEAVK